MVYLVIILKRKSSTQFLLKGVGRMSKQAKMLSMSRHKHTQEMKKNIARSSSLATYCYS